ncbi:MAG: YaeQ family protein [Candidatus Hermodarchaeota archaeon]
MEKSLKLPYQFEIKLIMEKEDNLIEQRHLYLRKGSSETFLHILIKILAYCYFWDEEEPLIIEPNYRFRKFKPDLVSFISSEIPGKLVKDVKLWIECKKVAVKKLIKLAKALHHSKIYWFHTYNAFQSVLKGTTVKKTIKNLKNLNLIAIKADKSTITSLSLDLGRKNPTWNLKWEQNILLVSNDNWKESIIFENDILKR